MAQNSSTLPSAGDGLFCTVSSILGTVTGCLHPGHFSERPTNSGLTVSFIPQLQANVIMPTSRISCPTRHYQVFRAQTGGVDIERFGLVSLHARRLLPETRLPTGNARALRCWNVSSSASRWQKPAWLVNYSYSRFAKPTVVWIHGPEPSLARRKPLPEVVPRRQPQKLSVQ